MEEATKHQYAKLKQPPAKLPCCAYDCLPAGQTCAFSCLKAGHLLRLLVERPAAWLVDIHDGIGTESLPPFTVMARLSRAL